MALLSVLRDNDDLPPEPAMQPDCFPDLHLDQIVDAMTRPRQEYNLKPLFWSPLRDPETIRYRQDVMRDLEQDPLQEQINVFAERMRTVRRYLALVEKLEVAYHRQGWILEAALVYSDAVLALARHLAATPLRSRGLLAFRHYLERYVRSMAFQTLNIEAQQVKQALAEITYCVRIEPGRFQVKRYEEEIDYSLEVEQTFAKFKQSDAQHYLVQLPERGGMSHIEAKILEFVARLYPEPFAALDRFCTTHAQFLDATIRAFDREIQFCMAYLDFIADLKRQGLPFCYPDVSATCKAISVRDGFDLALAHARRLDGQAIVRNDFFLQGAERILVVTGPNQGGKTTFARMVGQLHYLASLGCPVPGREARLFLCDHLFTHFERAEDIRNLRGKLEDDLLRMHEVLACGTADSIFILNEPFASTTLQDAIFLSKAIMARLIDLDALGVWVTFLDELASLSDKTVSMVALVDRDDPTRRTFKIVRRPADGLAYALSLAHKHGLTYQQLKERLG
jgi:DNA mismatch repair ATPase MutS